MEKTPLGHEKIDNGLKVMIQRHPGLRSRYVSAIIKRLKRTPGAKVYADSQIKRVVNDQVLLNLENKVIKDAFMEVFYELYPEQRPVGHATSFIVESSTAIDELIPA